ncbi:MAG: winged helix-turn-helix domain-containing protein [Methylocella sp.]
MTAMMETSFRIDPINLCLWRTTATGVEERLNLTPKTFDVLRYLVENPGRLVTHGELLGALWHDVHVQPEVLKSHILAIRSALGDKSASPRFIETQRGRGYRFIGPINGFASLANKREAVVELGVFAGRAEPLRQLLALLQRAASGEPQAAFISGEPGIGKTTLVQQFLAEARRQPDLVVAQGHCIEGFAGAEPYYPILEALGGLCKGAAGAGIIRDSGRFGALLGNPDAGPNLDCTADSVAAANRSRRPKPDGARGLQPLRDLGDGAPVAAGA